MHVLLLLLNPAVLGILAVFLSIVWMLKDESDRTRPLLVFALVLNLFYGLILKLFLGREDGLEPFKFDPILFLMDKSLGIQSSWVASHFHGAGRVTLIVVYQLLIPVMVCWFFVARGKKARSALVMAYIAELVTGPVFYAILPACGPLYAFGKDWLHGTVTRPDLIRLSGMPNAFPSLHMGTAMIFLLFAPSRVWRGVALIFLMATALATMVTGEHYVIDLAPGLIFGCYAVYAGSRRWRQAGLYLAVGLVWSLAIRFGFNVLIGARWLPISMTALTVALAGYAVWREWGIAPQPETTGSLKPPQVATIP